MKRLILAVALAPIAVVAGCGRDNNTPNEATYIVMAQNEIKARLKDPDSAEFRNVKMHMTTALGPETPATCGEVNANNSFGGKTGYQRFVSGGATVLESDMESSEFENVWSTLCP